MEARESNGETDNCRLNACTVRGRIIRGNRQCCKQQRYSLVDCSGYSVFRPETDEVTCLVFVRISDSVIDKSGSDFSKIMKNYRLPHESRYVPAQYFSLNG